MRTSAKTGQKRPKRDGLGRPFHERFEGRTDPKLRARLLDECRRRFERTTGLVWCEVEGRVDERVKASRSELAAAFESADRKPCGDLLDAMNAAVEYAGDRETPFAAWVKTNIQSLLERERHSLDLWAFQIRKEPGSMVTDFLNALDYLNFLALLDRPAENDELACVLILKGLELPVRKGKSVAIGQIISAVSKTVHKARETHGMTRMIERQRREMERFADPDGMRRNARELQEAKRKFEGEHYPVVSKRR